MKNSVRILLISVNLMLGTTIVCRAKKNADKRDNNRKSILK